MVDINERTGLPNVATASALAGDGMGIKDILVDNGLELQRITNVLTTQLTSIAQSMDTLVNATISANENSEFAAAEAAAEARRQGNIGAGEAEETVTDDVTDVDKPKANIGSAIRLGLIGLALGIQDAFEGVDVSEALGVEKLTGFVAGFFGGSLEGGFLSGLIGAVKGAALGAAIGMAFGPVGAIAGALIGGALFAITGFLGTQKMADFFDPIIVAFKRTLGLSVSTTEEELAIAKEMADEAKVAVDQISDNLTATEEAIADAINAGAPQEEILALRMKAIELREQQKVAQEKYNEELMNQMQMDRDKEKNAYNESRNMAQRNQLQISQLNMEKQQLENRARYLDKESAEYKDIQDRLAVNAAALEQAHNDRVVLQGDLAQKEAELLEQDRELVRIAREAGTRAPLRAELNVAFSNATESISNAWTNTADSITEWWDNVDLWPDETFNNVVNNINDAWDSLAKKIYNSETGELFGINFGAIFDSIPSIDDIMAKIKVSIAKTRIGSFIYGNPQDLIEEAESNLAAASDALGAVPADQQAGSDEAAELEKAKVQLEALKKAVAEDNGMNTGTIPDSLSNLNSMDPLMKDFGQEGTLAVLHNEEAVIPADSAVANYLDNLLNTPSSGTSTPGRAPINVRNNNPLNIRPPAGEQFQGTTGQSGGFATFASPEMGFRASAKLLETYQSKYNLDTIYKIISRWAPAGDNNDPKAYAEAVASKLGIGIDDPIDLSEDPELTQRLIAAMAEHEGGQSMSQMGFNNEQIAAGLAMATGEEQVPVNLAQSTISGEQQNALTSAPPEQPASQGGMFGALTSAFSALSGLDNLTGSIEGGLNQLGAMDSNMNIDGNILGSVSSDVNKERQGGGQVMIGDASTKNVNTVTNNTTNSRTINANIDARNGNTDVSRYNVYVTV